MDAVASILDRLEPIEEEVACISDLSSSIKSGNSKEFVSEIVNELETRTIKKVKENEEDKVSQSKGLSEFKQLPQTKRLSELKRISDSKVNLVSQSKRASQSPQPPEVCKPKPKPKYQAAEYYCCPKPIHQELTTTDSDDKKSYSSILKKPFIFRRSESLDKAVTLEEKRLIELYRQNQSVEEFSISSFSESTRYSTPTSSSCKSSSSVFTPETKSEVGIKDYMKRLLTPLEEHEDFEDVKVQPDSREKEVKFYQQESVAMTLAQKYLRLHRIFEFYQFLIAHLLSALPEDPIQFLLDLLDNCLAFRTGLCVPPLLYQEKHLEALFNVMDKMGSGYIDLQQYKAGMNSIGVCMIREDLFKNPEITISKKTFVDDALTALEVILSDILRRKYIKNDNSPPTPPPTPFRSMGSSRASTFTSTKSSSTRTKFSKYSTRTQ